MLAAGISWFLYTMNSLFSDKLTFSLSGMAPEVFIVVVLSYRGAWAGFTVWACPNTEIQITVQRERSCFISWLFLVLMQAAISIHKKRPHFCDPFFNVFEV